jgi:hypothetical protein
MDLKPKERQIPFSGDSVRALLEGRKTQARRVVKPQPDTFEGQTGLQFERRHGSVSAQLFAKNFCPYGGVGDLLWVRKKWASRFLLEITQVRVQRLGDIDGDDITAEGVLCSPGSSLFHRRVWFGEEWDKINAKRGYPWKKNPWVWALSFKRRADLLAVQTAAQETTR